MNRGRRMMMNKTIYGVSQLGLRPLTIEFLINGQSRKHTGPLYILSKLGSLW